MKLVVVGGEGGGIWPDHASRNVCLVWVATQLKPKLKVVCKNLLESSQRVVHL